MRNSWLFVPLQLLGGVKDQPFRCGHDENRYYMIALTHLYIKMIKISS